MYRKTKKLFAVALTVAMLLTMTAFSTVASAATGNRLEGADRYATALNIVKAGWLTSEYAVLATGEGYADALAAAPLAKAYSAPILLVDPATDNAAVKAELAALGVKTVFIVGGEGVVSKAFEDGLTGYTVNRLAGVNRVETSVKVAAQLVTKVGTISQIAVVNEDGYADALSIASIAANKNMPILLTYVDSLPTEVSAFLSGKTITKSYVLGETGVVSEAVKALLPNSVRLGGANRYATNYAVLSNFADLNYDNVVIATGENYPDALAGSAYAAKLYAPVVLVEDYLTTDLLNLVQAEATASTKVLALGGAAVVSNSVVDGLVSLINGLVFKIESVSVANAAQIQVKFTKPVSSSTVVEDNGTLVANVFTVNVVNGTGTVTVTDSSLATLSADGRTLTITAASGDFSGLSFVLTVPADKIKDADGNYMGTFTSSVVAGSDAVAPTVASVVKLNASKVRVNFSEPLFSAGNWTFKFADGTTAAVTPAESLAKGYVDLTIDAGVTAGKAITATIIGATDYAYNLITPNPVTVNFTKGDLDGTKPTVSSITPLSLGSFEIKFSEEVQGFDATDVTVDGVARTANDATETLAGTEATVTQDDTDVTKYVVEFVPFTETGLHAIGLAASAVNDLSGEVNNAYAKVYQLTKDTTAPTLVSYEVKSVSGTEYLYLTFSEGVNAGTVNALTTTRVKNYVTVYGTVDLTGIAAVASTSDKQYRIALNDVEFDPNGDEAAATIENGATYTVAIGGKFTDKSNVALGTTSISFARGVDVNSAKPAIVTTVDGNEPDGYVDNNGIDIIDNDTFQVTFDKALDGASATNKANYVVSGATVKSATLLPNNIVEIKLESGTNTISGLRNVTISGVRSSAGVIMDTFAAYDLFVENVKPTVSSATLIAPNKVKVVFTEAVDYTKVSAADFDVYVGTTKEDETAPFAVATEDDTPTAYESAYIITLTDNLSTTEYAQDLTVKLVTDATAASVVVDANGNKVATGTFAIAK